MLFKYRSINCYFWEMLNKREIWCPQADSLNDPFEFEFQLSEQNVLGIPIIKKEVDEAKALTKRHFGIISFAEICNSIQMWAYYADAHKGVCLGFERNEENDLGNWDYCLPVIYHPDNELPAYMPLKLEDRESIAKIFTTKSFAWNHEHEWRAVTRKRNTSIPYPGRLARVVFGVCTTQENRERIMETLGAKVKYSEARMSETHYKLEIVELD